jgi:hypothetical protein
VSKCNCDYCIRYPHYVSLKKKCTEEELEMVNFLFDYGADQNYDACKAEEKVEELQLILLYKEPNDFT